MKLIFIACVLLMRIHIYAENKSVNDAYYPWYIECTYNANDIVEINTDEEGYINCNLYPADTSARTCLLFYVDELDTAITIPEGTYTINNSKEIGTVAANPGTEDHCLFPSFYCAMSSDGYLQAPIWLITNGTVEVSKTIDNKLHLEVDATTPEGFPVHVVYNGSNIPNAVENTTIPALLTQKIIRNGTLIIVHKGKEYSIMGIEIK